MKKIIVAKDTKQNLCDTCPNCFGTCGANRKFSDGRGEDNVIECDLYAGLYSPEMEK